MYMVYYKPGTDELKPGTEVFVGDVLDFDEDDNEILPEAVSRQGLEQGYMREHLQDVVDLAIKQKPSASTAEIIQCLNH